MAFKNPPVAGGGELVRDVVHSRGWANPGDDGWGIKRDGNSYFNNVTVDVPDMIYSTSSDLQFMIAKADYESPVYSQQPATQITTAVRAQWVLESVPVELGPLNPLRTGGGNAVVHHFEICMNIRPNAGAAANFNAELDMQQNGGGYVTQTRRLITRMQTNGDRAQFYQAWDIDGDTDSSIDFKIMVYHTGAVAYTVQNNADSWSRYSRRLSL